MTSMCHIVGDTTECKTEKIILAGLGFMFQKDETDKGLGRGEGQRETQQ